MKIGQFDCPPSVLTHMAGQGGRELAVARMMQYSDRMMTEYAAMAPYLPANVSSILDIGCGLGGIDILLGKHYPGAALNMMDGDGSEPRLVGFKNSKAWGKLSVGLAFVRANLPRTRKVVGHKPNPDATIESDLIVSLLSWGHHYPIDVYLDLVQRSRRPQSIVITDIRRGTDGARKLQKAGLTRMAKIGETPKCERLVFG